MLEAATIAWRGTTDARISVIRHAVRAARSLRQAVASERDWIQSGRPLPTPPYVKRAAVRSLAKQFRLPVFIETGTLYGDTLASVAPLFEELHSIELDEGLYENAIARLAGSSKVRIWHGDSAEVLPRILADLRRPAFFWLDGHYSGAGTARGSMDSPIVRELELIALHPLREKHFILVDDAREFTGQNGYPTMEQIREFCQRGGFSHCRLSMDMIQISSLPS